MNYYSMRRYDIANAPGISASLFVCGCNLNCEGCFNKELQDFNYGKPFDDRVKQEFLSYARDDKVTSISLLGGDFVQQDTSEAIELLKELVKIGKPIWCWTGYTLEELTNMGDKIQILSYIDVLVDGRFVQNQLNLNLKYRGSSNQRVINMKETIKKRKIILWGAE